MFCIYCGAEMKDDAKYCPNCGAKLEGFYEEEEDD